MSCTRDEIAQELAISNIAMDSESPELPERQSSTLDESDILAQAKEIMALQRVGDYLYRIIASHDIDEAISLEDDERTIAQIYLNIINKKFNEYHIKIPKLFEFLKELKDVQIIVDGNDTLDEKIMLMNNKYPRFTSALESFRVLLEDKKTLGTERTLEYKYSDLFPSHYLLKNKIKECIAESRRKKCIKYGIEVKTSGDGLVNEDQLKKDGDNELEDNSHLKEEGEFQNSDERQKYGIEDGCDQQEDILKNVIYQEEEFKTFDEDDKVEKLENYDESVKEELETEDSFGIGESLKDEEKEEFDNRNDLEKEESKNHFNQQKEESNNQEENELKEEEELQTMMDDGEGEIMSDKNQEEGKLMNEYDKQKDSSLNNANQENEVLEIEENRQEEGSKDDDNQVEDEERLEKYDNEDVLGEEENVEEEKDISEQRDQTEKDEEAQEQEKKFEEDFYQDEVEILSSENDVHKEIGMEEYSTLREQSEQMFYEDSRLRKEVSFSSEPKVGGNEAVGKLSIDEKELVKTCREDNLMKYLLITEIKKILSENKDNLEHDVLMNLETTPEFEDFIKMWNNNVKHGLNKQLKLKELRNKILNFKEFNYYNKLYRKTPLTNVLKKDSVLSNLSSNQLDDTKVECSKSFVDNLKDVILRFKNRTSLSEGELDEFIGSESFKKLTSKITEKRSETSIDLLKRKKKISDLLMKTSKLLETGQMSVFDEELKKFKLEELAKLNDSEVVDLLSSIHKRTSVDTIPKSVKFAEDGKWKFQGSQRKKLFYTSLDASSSKGIESNVLSTDSIECTDSMEDPGPIKKYNRRSDIEEMMAHIAIPENRDENYIEPENEVKIEKAPSQQTTIRLAKTSDLGVLQNFVTSHTTDLFGDKTLHYYLEYSNSCIVQLDKDNEQIAFIAIQNDPSVPILPPSSWDIWIHELYKQQDNIDIMPELDKVAPQFSKTFGNYLISELVRFSSEDRIGLTATVNDKIVGYALINSNVRCSSLNKSFEVAAFNGFYTPHKDDYHPVGRTTRKIQFHYPELPQDIAHLFIIPETQSVENSSNITDLPEQNESEMELVEEYAEGFVTVPCSFIFSSTFVKQRQTVLLSRRDLNFQASNKLIINLSSLPLMEGILAHPHETDRNFLVKNMTYNPPPIEMSNQVPEEAIYYGEPNAVMIEIFLMLNCVDFRLSYDFLEAIIEAIDVDYCILSLPTGDSMPEIVDHFSRLIPRIGTWFPHEVYVLHRAYILSQKSVRPANRDDLVSVMELTTKVANYKKIRDDFIVSLFVADTTFESYVLLCCDIVVGLCIVDKCPLPLTKIEVEFDIEKYMAPSLYKKHASIKHCCIHPIFSACSTMLYREVIRMSSVFCLFYRLFSEDIISKYKGTATVISCIGDLIPVIPRQPLQYHSDLDKTFQDTNENANSNFGFFHKIVKSKVDETDEKFALYYMNTRVGNSMKRGIHLKIVVVGASDTALSFIESLIFRTENDLIYTNVVLVCPHGLPYRQKPHAARDAMTVFRGRYNRDFITKLGMTSLINITFGYMTSIDRKRKFIIIDCGKKINYDYLFIFCGQQFMKPVFHNPNEKIEKNADIFERNERASNNYMNELPFNIFLINTDIDASYSLLNVEKIMKEQKSLDGAVIVVYGHMLEALAVLNALKIFGIPGRQIAYVESFPNEPAEALFNDSTIDKAVQAALEQEDITVYSPYYLTDWEFDATDNMVRKLHFQSIENAITIPCICFYAFDFKSTDLRTFMALINAQLVYDGKLIIDNEFRTNDKYIYAAGPLTRYSRKYFSDHMSHEFFNSIEVGVQVFKKVKDILNTRKTDLDEQKQDRKEGKDDVYLSSPTNLPELHRPRIESCQLVGGWNYLRVIKPGKVLPLENQLSNNSLKGPTFVTGDCTSENGPGYFKLVLDQNKIVIEIVCFTKQKIEVYNLMKLYGKHVSLFNNLEQRYNLGIVDDLFYYFRQPWSYAMYHDKFYFIEKKNRRRFHKSRRDIESNQIPFSSIIKDFLVRNNWENLSEDSVEQLRKLLHNETTIPEEIRASLKKFFVANELYLPMYINYDYIIVKNEEVTKRHLHSKPPLGKDLQSVKKLAEILKNVPDGMTMQEYQKLHFKSTENKSVETEKHGFRITSYLSFHSGVDSEQYRESRETSPYSYETSIKEDRAIDIKETTSQGQEFESGNLLNVESENSFETNGESTAAKVSSSNKLKEESPSTNKSSLSVGGIQSSNKFEQRLDSKSLIKKKSSSYATSNSSWTSSVAPPINEKLSTMITTDSVSDLDYTETDPPNPTESSTVTSVRKRSSSKMTSKSGLLVDDQSSHRSLEVSTKLPSTSVVKNSTSTLKIDSKENVENVKISSENRISQSKNDPNASKESIKSRAGSSVVISERASVELHTKSGGKSSNIKTEVNRSQDLVSTLKVTNVEIKTETAQHSGSKTFHLPLIETSSSSTSLRRKASTSKSKSNSKTKIKESESVESATKVSEERQSESKLQSSKNVLPQINKKTIQVNKIDSKSQSHRNSPMRLSSLLDQVQKLQTLKMTSFEDVHNIRWKKLPAVEQKSNVLGGVENKRQSRKKTLMSDGAGPSKLLVAAHQDQTFSQCRRKCGPYKPVCNLFEEENSFEDPSVSTINLEAGKNTKREID